MNNLSLNYSPHTDIRCQQRGIKKEVINFIVNYGQCRNSHQDKKYFINKKLLNKLSYKHELFIKKFDKQILRVGVIVNNNTVITAFQIDRNFLWN